MWGRGFGRGSREWGIGGLEGDHDSRGWGIGYWGMVRGDGGVVTVSTKVWKEVARVGV